MTSPLRLVENTDHGMTPTVRRAYLDCRRAFAAAIAEAEAKAEARKSATTTRPRKAATG